MNKRQAIDGIMEHFAYSEAVPTVSGGQGGAGYELLLLDESKWDTFRESLEEADFEEGVEPAADFNDSVDSDDYTGCVKFTWGNGLWMQFLTW